MLKGECINLNTKRILAVFTTLLLVISLSSCGGKEITLNLSYGDRTGKYTGEMNDDGIPNGNGKFVTQNEDGEKWTYEGEFKDGHFEGNGVTTWKNGAVDIGTYKNDEIVPLEGDAVKTLFTTPENFKNHFVKLTGQVFGSPGYTDDGVTFSMWTDIENFGNEVLVNVLDPEFKVEQDDYILLTGKVIELEDSSQVVNVPIIAATEYSN